MFQRGLGCGVMRKLGCSIARNRGAEVNDGPFRFAQGGVGFLHQHRRGHDIQRAHVGKHLCVIGVYRQHLTCARVVDDQIQPSPFVQRRLDDAGAAVGVGTVDLQGFQRSTGCGHFSQPRCVAPGDQHPCAAFGQRQRSRLADARTTPGHDRDLVLPHVFRCHFRVSPVLRIEIREQV